MIYSNENSVPSDNSFSDILERNIITDSENQLTNLMRLRLFDTFDKHLGPFGDISNIKNHEELCNRSGTDEFLGKSNGYKLKTRRNYPCKRPAIPNKSHCFDLTVPCLQPVKELREMCQKLKLRFIDCSDDVYMGGKLVGGNSCTVKCLQTYADLKHMCAKLNVKPPAYWDEIDNFPNQHHNLKNCHVKCLQTIKDLEEICTNLKLNFNGKENIYEVDLLFANSIKEEETYFLVKWESYSSMQNTWEPESSLIGCQDLVKHYKALERSDIYSKDLNMKFFIKELLFRKPYDLMTMRKLCGILMGKSHDDHDILNFSLTDLRNKAKEIHSLSTSKFCELKNSIFELMKFSEERKKVLINLKEWEEKINACNPSAYIKVENDVDLEKAPSDFHFIHDYSLCDAPISEGPIVFCDCDNCTKYKKHCCPTTSEASFAYSSHRRLLLRPGYPIYECNKLCKCGPDCINRVVQHGQKIKVAIFRTSYGCGWGLKTLEIIEKDQFVLEYLGEILTSEAAEARGKEYDYFSRSYLFDLDYNSKNNLYTIDARHKGNASHFINHSCQPNMHVFSVWIDHSDPDLPRLAFFAKRKIRRGEELTFDYNMAKYSERFDSSEEISKSYLGSPMSPVEEKIPCRCNTKKCRKFLF